MMLLWGCAEGDGPESGAPASEAHDSAGVRIVENGAPAWGAGAAWTVSPEPTLQIGALEGEYPYLFEDVEQVERLPDGRILVVEGDRREIRFYDDAGRHLRTLGGPGEGPGEFQTDPDVVLLPGDTLLAYDGSASRMSWFGPDGGLVRDEPFTRDDAPENMGGVFSIDRILFPDGSFFHVGSFAPSNTEMVEPLPGFFAYSPVPDGMAHLDRRLGLVRGPGDEVVFGRFPVSESGYVEGDGPLSAFRIYNDYYPTALWSVEARPFRVHIATRGRREVRTYDDRGELLRIVRQLVPLEPLHDEAIAREREEVRDSAAARGNLSVGAVMELFDRIEFPDSVFPYTALTVDSEGALWLERHTLEADSSVALHTVIGPDGRWLGTVPLPRSVGEIAQIGPDFILSVYTDEFDVPYVRLYDLDRGPDEARAR